MNEFFEKLKKGILLKEDEKTRVKESILKYVELNPVRNDDESRLKVQRSQTNLIEIANLLRLKTMPILFSIIMLVSLGTASIAAEKSLPGDTLYPIKVNVNEKVKSALIYRFNSESEYGGQFEIEKAERRIKEAEKLAIKGLLSEESKNKIGERFDTHVEKMSRVAATLADKGNVEAAVSLHSRLEAVLDAHRDVIDQLGDGEITKDDAEDLIKEVKNEINEKVTYNAELKSAIENNIKTGITPIVKTAAEGKLKAAENKLAETQSFIVKNSAELSAEVKLKIDERILESKKAIADGRAKFEAEKYGEAFILFQKSIRLSQQAKTIAKTHIELEDDSDDDDENSTSTESDDEDEDDDEEEDEDDEENDDSDSNTSTSLDIKTKTKLKLELDM